jgi:hypothetical protein
MGYLRDEGGVDIGLVHVRWPQVAGQVLFLDMGDDWEDICLIIAH